MIQVKKSQERYNAEHGWLKSKHTFSFAEYYDVSNMGFSVLRVINEDRIEGGTGFGKHEHSNMEIISYVIDGALEHKDSMGNATVIKPGEIQRMSAGTGVSHSEYNHLHDEEAHFLQIWVMPKEKNIKPSYDQKSCESHLSDLTLVISQDSRGGSVSINQDIEMYAAKTITAGEKILPVAEERKLWIQIIKGEVQTEGHTLTAGDAAALNQIEKLNLKWTSGSEFLVFNLP